MDEQSIQKLEQASSALRPWINSGRLVRQPCSKWDATGYRCKCSFQIIQRSDSNGVFQYALREGPVPIPISKYPPANRRIQIAMEKFLTEINSGGYPCMSQGLASTVFSSSWSGTASHNSPTTDNEIIQRSILLLTLNYCYPLHNETMWEREARSLLSKLQLSQINGRSRKHSICVPDQLSNGRTIHDIVWLVAPRQSSESHDWKVHLHRPEDVQKQELIPVKYDKPEDAFFHPNPRVMCRALEWLLQRISLIVSSVGSHVTGRLLEMYCGCGAHSIALAQSRLLKHIDAIEIDERLVRACRSNIHSNGVQSILHIYCSDASRWATRINRSDPSGKDSGYDILIVDPPRQGLGEDVCQMACRTASIGHFLYISCGRDALCRDLERLGDHFEVVDCVLLDLFPGTYSVESLVHLQRRE